MRSPSDVDSVRAARSIAVTVTPSRSATPRPAGSASVTSGSASFPASTPDSRIRLYARCGSAPIAVTGRYRSRACSSAASRAPAIPYPTTTTLMPDPRCAAVRHEAPPHGNSDSLADARSCQLLHAGGADLELGHPRRRIERVVGQRVDARPVERGEQRVRPDGVHDPGGQYRRAAATDHADRFSVHNGQ